MFGNKKELKQATLGELCVDPFVRVIDTGKDQNLKIVLDSRIPGDVDRKVVVSSLTETNPVFTLSSEASTEILRFSLDVHDGTEGAKRNLLTIQLPMQLFPGSNSATIDQFIERVRAAFLSLIAQGVATPALAQSEIKPVQQEETIGCADRPKLRPSPRSLMKMFEQPSHENTVQKGRLKKWAPRLIGLAVVALLVYGLSGLFSKKDPDPLAGLDPQLRKQIEAAGVRGATNPAAANVTEETLKAMGLDPGKAATNAGCLVGQ